MKRPPHLPDFTEPPLDEVVLGVQFTPIPSYSTVFAGEVWNLFKDSFPIVEEQPLLQPQFETFGGANPQPSFQFQVGLVPLGSRLWFISNDENHLLQFQSDRFLSNWRKRANMVPYPRFEDISVAFESNLKMLSAFLSNNLSYKLDINQVEVSYINMIPVEEFSNIGDWLAIWQGVAPNIEGLNIAFSEAILDSEGKAMARLSHLIQSGFMAGGGRKAFNLSMTFRGRPSGSNIESVMDFLRTGREAIVNRFAEITTKQAHEFWGRQ